MLRSKIGLRPAPRSLAVLPRMLVSVLVTAFFALALPSLANATSTSLDLSDPAGSGLGASLTIDDMLVPGSLSITISLTSTNGSTGDLRFFMLDFSDSDLSPGLATVNGTDVYEKTFYSTVGTGKGDACPCRLEIDLGGPGRWEPTGLQTASFVVSYPTADLSLASIADDDFWIALGLDVPSGGPRLYDDDYDDYDDDGYGTSTTFIKLDGKISVIPEPTTAVLMLLGLTGLSVSTRRLGPVRR